MCDALLKTLTGEQGAELLAEIQKATGINVVMGAQDTAEGMTGGFFLTHPLGGARVFKPGAGLTIMALYRTAAEMARFYAAAKHEQAAMAEV